jgi:hypothetical protein
LKAQNACFKPAFGLPTGDINIGLVKRFSNLYPRDGKKRLYARIFDFAVYNEFADCFL